MKFAVFWDGPHGGAFFFLDVVGHLLVPVLLGLELPHDGFEFGQFIKSAILTEPFQKCLEDAEGHFAKG